MNSAKDWLTFHESLDIKHQAFIDGVYCDAQSGKTFAANNPATGQKIADIACCDKEDLQRAVEAARNSFEAGVWSRCPGHERKKTLKQVAEKIRENKNELALLETLDMGKNIRDSLNVDMPRVAETFEWYAEAIDKLYGEVSPSTHNGLGTITAEPLGVVGVIVPWNFPLLMAAWKLAPALAAGNSVILKPSERSSLTAIRLAALLKEAGLPDGVVNVLPGLGHDLGEAMGLHPDIDCITFTGSTATGKRLMQYAGQSNLKKVFAECGGKSPNIIFADSCSTSEQMDKVAAAAASAIFFNQGEVCVAGSRLLLEESIAVAFLKTLCAVAKKMQPGDPLDSSCYMGALVDEHHMKQVLNYIQRGEDEGAHLLMGGKQVLAESGGFFVEPAIFTNVTAEMTIFREEIFGPVLSVTTFSTEEQAVTLANDTCFGLAAGLWTQQLNRAHRVARRLRAGSVWVNGWSAGDLTMPFGGYKQSGNGRDRSLHALEKFTEQKSTWFSF